MRKTQVCAKCKGTGRVIDSVAEGKRLRTKREKQNISLRFFAKRLGCAPMHLSNLERGVRTWSETMIQKYEKTLLCNSSP